jgi:hypothetical protein
MTVSKGLSIKNGKGLGGVHKIISFLKTQKGAFGLIAACIIGG